VAAAAAVEGRSEAQWAAAQVDTADGATTGDDDRRCSICLERFVCGQLARSLPCSHVFHAECIDEWLTSSSRACPEDGLPVLGEADMAAVEEDEAREREAELAEAEEAYAQYDQHGAYELEHAAMYAALGNPMTEEEAAAAHARLVVEYGRQYERELEAQMADAYGEQP